MLQFSEYFSEHEETDRMIREAINNRLIGLMDTIISQNGSDDLGVGSIDTIRLSGSLQHYFPGNLNYLDTAKIFLGLYRLLKSRESMVPDLQMEYLLYKILVERIALSEIYGLGTIARLPKREQIENNLHKYEPELDESQIRTALDRLEDLKNYQDFCFWDMDFLILEELPGVLESSRKEMALTGGAGYEA